MANISTDLMEMILRKCARTAPQPWYPSAYAQETGLSREELDASLDELRLGGLVRLTDWVQGRGQGYALTPEGQAVLDSPRLLDRLRTNGVPVRPVAAVAARSRRAEERPTAWDRGEEVRAVLTSPAPPRVTMVLLFLNLLVFAVGYALAARAQVRFADYIEGSGQAVGQVLHSLGALQASDIVNDGQWWRLIACCFVHFGLLHLGMNMVSLFLVGPLIERMWGSWGFLVLYLISGLVGSCAMMIFSAPNFLGAGASGALWGILGSMATWLFLNRNHLPRQLVAIWSRRLLIVFLLNVFISSLPGISAAAHFGGGIAGLVVGVALHYARHGPLWLRWLAILGIVAVPLVALAAVQYRVEPARERVQEVQQEVQVLNQKYMPAFSNALNAEVNVYRGDHIALLLSKPVVDRRNEADGSQVAKNVSDLMKTLTATAQSLATANSFREPAVVEFLQAAKAYIEAAVRFYQDFEKSLDDQQLWTRNKEREMIELHRHLLTLRADVEKLLERPHR